MKRPFAALGFSVYGGLMLASWAGPDAAQWLIWLFAALAGCGFVAGKCLKKMKAVGLAGAFAVRAPLFSVSCFMAGLAVCLFLHSWNTRFAPVQHWAGASARIQAQVMDYPEERYHRYYYRLQVERVGDEAVEPFVVRLSAAQSLPCGPFDSVDCAVTFFSFEADGLYSPQNARLADGTVLGAYLSDMDARRVPDLRRPFMQLFCQLRRGASRNFQRLLPREDAAFLTAMVLGRRDGLPEEEYASFQLIGCSHLLVISGLHMGALCGLVLHSLSRMGLSRFPRSLLTSGVLLGFLCVTGFPVSAVRACIMAGVYLLGGCLGRRADSVNSLGLALLVICLQDPFSGGDLGLALSVFATLGIVTGSRPLEAWLLRLVGKRERLRRLLRPAAGTMAVTLCAMGFTLPWQLLAFGGVSLLAPLANLVLILPCTLLLYCGFFVALCSLLPALAPLAAPFAFCAGWLCRFIRWAAQKLASQPGTYLHLHPAGLAALGFCLLLLAMLFIPGTKGTNAPACTICACIAGVAVFSGLWSAFIGRGAVTVYIAGENGSGSILLVQDRKAAVLALGGQPDTAVDALRQANVWQVEALFLPESTSEARQSARQVLQAFKVGRLVLPQGAYVGKDLAAGGVPIEAVPEEGSFQALPGVEVRLQGGEMLFSIYGVPFALKPGADGAGDWRLAVAGGANSIFTVLPPGAIIEPGLPAGAYLVPKGRQGMDIQITPQGSVAMGKGG